MSKVLVTGGAGFIGSHLCDRLLAEGHRVICLDNFFTGSRKNIEHHLNDKNFELIEGDITEPYDNGPVDEIYNLACPASPIHYVKDPVETVRTNVLGMANMLEYARKHQAKILQASTSEVYGDPKVHPQKESYWGNVNPIGPRSVYDEAKRYAEAMTFAYRRTFKVDTRVVRIFNTYGPRMNINDGRVVPNFIDQALKGLPITIYGDGKQTRSFCYVDDEADGILKLLFSRESGPVNIGNPCEFDMIEFAKLVLELTGAKSKLVYTPLPEDDPKQRKPDITLARKVLRWEPKVSLREGLVRTIAWFKDNI